MPSLSSTVRDLIDDRPAEGIFRVHSRLFTDPALFDLEMKLIFARTWNFLGFEADLSKAHDFVTTSIGRTPVLVTRSKDGEVGAFLNRCPHRGATVCQQEMGSARAFVCPYHAWTFDSAGQLIGMKEKSAGAYPSNFDAMAHGLTPLARVGIYRGLIFGSLSEDVASLEDHLGPMKFFIDLAMDQGSHGMEPIPGRSVYSFRGNWKLQLDNGLDGYHLTTAHASFLEVMMRRRTGQGNTSANSLDFAKNMDARQSAFAFPNGHCALVNELPEDARRPFIDMEEVRSRIPEERARWVDLNYNTLIFPNLQLIQNTALALRIIRPLSPDLTEMHYFCLGAIGEDDDRRAMRLRAFEDFYNAAGLATPDDSAVYEMCQRGLAGGDGQWLQGYMRGVKSLEPGDSERARAFGVRADQSATGSIRSGFETQLHAAYRQWAAMMGDARMEAA
ncbi:aromatic ring-hydroxylating oxygenase subunit alpha [Sphingobium estronivorans]|uniref:aromatic ring-hydroxylating oxygenase subunit alpha n=1 Tax=Sphingobium estronivorans TaxID=1577690 RepID=UPI00123A93CA|nr:Rieske 2Fe-2S domain-containing protein [Sphingobium estronivorans]